MSNWKPPGNKSPYEDLGRGGGKIMRPAEQVAPEHMQGCGDPSCPICMPKGGRGVRLLGGEIDEAPQAYRRLPDVLEEHAGTIRRLHTLRPFAVAMAGEGEFDPYKD